MALAGVFGFLGVTLGAFGAHALPGYLARTGLDPQEVQRRLSIAETGVRYHMFHCLAILIVGIAWQVDGGLNAGWWRGASMAFTLGVVIFSGSLYTIVGTGNGRWGMVTPLGGLAFLAGWIAVVIASLRGR
jgi:uncharacterized membrane protein YgdD (TMEM256/DUF423 family)